jgi:hypothetical protein
MGREAKMLEALRCSLFLICIFDLGMNTRITILLFFLSTSLLAQHKIVRTLESKATHITIFLEGIDNLKIEESDNQALEMTLLDLDELGVKEGFSCEDKSCVLQIKTVQKKAYKINDKIHQFPLAPPSNVQAVIKIPKHKNVSILSEMIDIQTQGYEGVLQLTIDKGNIRVAEVKNKVILELFSGAIYATIDKETSCDIHTRNGHVSLDQKKLASPYKKEKKSQKKLEVKSIHANVVLRTKKT